MTNFPNSLNQNRASPGPPFPDLKNTTSQLSLEKKIKALTFLDQILTQFEIW